MEELIDLNVKKGEFYLVESGNSCFVGVMVSEKQFLLACHSGSNGIGYYRGKLISKEDALSIFDKEYEELNDLFKSNISDSDKGITKTFIRNMDCFKKEYLS